MIDIIPVDKSNTEETIKLLNRIFPRDINRYNNPEIGIKCSQDPEKYKEYYEHFKLEWTNPFVLKEDGKIIGTTGIYHLNTDPDDTVWLGWFCIAPEHRGRGLGRKLLEWTMDLARSRSFRKLKLYTSDDPDLANSEILYDKLGFKEIGREPGDGETIIYKEVTL